MKVFQNAKAMKKLFSVAQLSYPVSNTWSNWKQTTLRLHFSCVVNKELGLFLIINCDSQQNSLTEYQC